MRPVAICGQRPIWATPTQKRNSGTSSRHPSFVIRPSSFTMPSPFISGALAGYAIAIPVGAISILIFETGLRRGLWPGLAAGTGTATADGIFATIAAVLGTTLVTILAPVATLLKWGSALFLIGLGIIGLWTLYKIWRAGANLPDPPLTGVGRTYLSLLGLTLLNPTTIAYFAALILGMNVAGHLDNGERVLFVLGAFLASWSWQSVLAILGALLHKHLSPNFRHITSLVGNCMIIALGIQVLR